MEDTFINSFVDQRNSWEQKLGAGRFVATGYRSSQLFDRSAKLAPVVTVDLITFGVLSNALFC